MGLDMFLTGERHWYERSERKRGDKKAEQYDLGYWRKHPDLHGFIVEEFADGEDDCRDIELTRDRIGRILAAVKNGELPETTGFFFGTSEKTDERIANDLEIFEDALDWLDAEEPDVLRTVSYRASW